MSGNGRKPARGESFTAPPHRPNGNAEMIRRHPLILPLLALLLATRALVPTGWMPVIGQGGVHITLCTGQGMVGATLGPDGKVHHDSSGDQGPHDPCPYGALTHAVDTPALPAIAPAPAPQPEAHVAMLSQQRVHALHAPRPPTRGPPAFA